MLTYLALQQILTLKVSVSLLKQCVQLTVATYASCVMEHPFHVQMDIPVLTLTRVNQELASPSSVAPRINSAKITKLALMQSSV